MDTNITRAQRFAGKLLAEGLTPQATDAQMHDAFARCVRPAPRDLYPAIREQARILTR